MVWSPENWEWSGWMPCRQDVFRDRYTANSFFHSGRNAAEERFWKKFVHRDGSYDAGGVQGRYVYSTWPAVDQTINEAGEEDREIFESEKEDLIEDVEEDLEKEEQMEEEKEEQMIESTKEKSIVERGRKRSKCLHCSCSRSRSASWGRVEQARVSKIERAKAAGDLNQAYPSSSEKLIRAYPTSSEELIRAYPSSSGAYQNKNAAFVSRIERARATGELIRASSRATVPVA